MAGVFLLNAFLLRVELHAGNTIPATAADATPSASRREKSCRQIGCMFGNHLKADVQKAA